MKRFLSITLAIALLLGLGSLAVLARPGGSSEPGASVVAQVESSQQTASQPAAPQAQNKVNVIALPLNNSAQFTSAGKSFNADGLAFIVGTGVTQVLTWNANASSYRTWDPDAQDGDNFALAPGGVYRLVLDSGYTGAGVSFVGDVPAQGSISFTLKRPLLSGCIINDISIPLDRFDLTSAHLLAVDVGYASQVLEWDAANQSYRTWDEEASDGDNFPVKIGYPYRLCLLSNGIGAEETWP